MGDFPNAIRHLDRSAIDLREYQTRPNASSRRELMPRIPRNDNESLYINTQRSLVTPGHAMCQRHHWKGLGVRWRIAVRFASTLTGAYPLLLPRTVSLWSETERGRCRRVLVIVCGRDYRYFSEGGATVTALSVHLSAAFPPSTPLVSRLFHCW